MSACELEPAEAVDGTPEQSHATKVSLSARRRRAPADYFRSVGPATPVFQVGLFPIEIAAYAAGVITKLSGIVPNEILHLVLAGGFVFFAARVKTRAALAG